MSKALLAQIDGSLVTRTTADGTGVYCWYGGPWIHRFDEHGNKVEQLEVWVDERGNFVQGPVKLDQKIDDVEAMIARLKGVP